MKFKKLILAVALTGVFTLAACNSTPNPDSGNNGGNGTQDTVKLEGIKIQAEGNVTKLSVGKTLKLTAVPTPASASADVNWSSSNQEVATVSQDGTVSALKPGLTVIKAVSKNDDKIKAEYSLTVEKAAAVNPTGITLSTQDNIKEVEVGKTLKINATVTPAEADQGVKFSSNDETIAKVTNAGIVTGVKEGKVIITATSTKLNTIKQTIEITVTKSNYKPDKKWEEMAFSNHEAFMNAEKDTMLKIKGTVTHKVEGKDGSTTNYFLQNGNEGFYVSGQELALGNIEVGSTYAVGGTKKYNRGQHNNCLASIEYFVALDEKLPVNTIDLSNSKDFSLEGQKNNIGAKVQLNDVQIASLPDDFASSKGFNVSVKKGDATIDLRVAPSDTSQEQYAALGELFKGTSAGQGISIVGYMTTFGYGAAVPQIVIASTSDVTIKPLDDAAKVKLALEGIDLPFTLDKDVTTITLPTENSKFKEVKLAWTSSSELISVEKGTVSHGDRDTTVKLTLTASLNGQTAQKDFSVNILSKADDYLTEVGKLDFEDASPEQNYGCSATKPGYKNGNVNLGGHNWALNNALIGGAEDDRRNGTYGARLQTSSDDNSVTLLDSLEFNTVEFILANYGKNKLGAIIEVSYAVGDSNEFIKLEQQYVLNDYKTHKVRVKLPVEKGSKVKVRISAVKGHGQRLNIDDIRLLLEA